jgi:hypothetical protein
MPTLLRCHASTTAHMQNASTKPENYPFPEAELGAHVLRMCPLAWQDQYNLNEKGMMPMDMRKLLTLLEAIERVCTHEKGKPDEKSEKSSFNGKRGKKRPGTHPTVHVPKKVQFEKHCNLCEKHGCENILHGYLYVFDLAFSHHDGIHGFKFPSRFLGIYCRDLTSLLLN